MFKKSNINIFFLLMILLLGLALRLWGLSKDGGLWFDELLTWNISRQSFPFGILHKIMAEDFHFPLYYFMLHFWMKIFGDGDFMIRGLSLLFGVITIPVAYLAGKELDGEKNGLICASLVAVNSFLIYFSQEVRFYSLLSMLGFSSIYCLLRFIKKPSVLNSSLLVIINLCILYTNTVAFLFVFVESFVFFLFFSIHKKELIKPFLINQLLMLFFFAPGMLMLLKASLSVSSLFIKPFTWWGEFDVMTIVSTLQSWFSPIFFDGYNTAKLYYMNAVSADMFLAFLILIPILTFILLIVLGLKLDKCKSEKTYVFFVGLFLFLLLVCLCFIDKFRLISRYTTLCLPPLLIFVSYSISQVKNRRMLMGLFFILCFINLLCYSDASLSTPLNVRSSGIKYVVDLLNSRNISSQDVIFMGEGGVFLPRYMRIDNDAIIPFMEFNAFVRGNKSDLKLIMSDKVINYLNVNNSRDLLRGYIQDESPSQELSELVGNKINSLARGRYFILVAPRWTIDSVGMLHQKSEYDKQSLLYLLMVKTYNDVLKSVYYNPQMQLSDKVDKNYWSIFIFSKK